ncbi:MAG: LysR family transcriptional regulator [Deltaproteobacteria bacterium CG_4_8_14_3_um_filter_45_9]|nr:MAG: LysR family transcriptional regulator [Deltaproteobacteria bacterium CG03_land_8_20_14_0_80_45_14]PIX26072.1 MAG: LysR family transcriptional regulator [Deltaproteobacteria bacterium CG_4_8_14_3_um_filter_45_9]
MERKPLQIEFRHLETFCRVADLKSFSKAADDLFLTQPTVSGHILSLEESLSLRLFDRTSREVRLTKAGEVFQGYASKILSFRKDLLNALSEFSQGIRGELSLGASTIPGEYLLPKLMGDFKKEHPRFIISLKIADTKEITQYVLQDHVEFGIIGAKLNHPSLLYEKYKEDEIIVVAPSDHPLTRKKRVNLQELLKEPWIIREEGSGTQIAVEKALRKKGKSLKQFNVVMEMGSTSSVKEGVKAKLGLAFISKRATEEEVSQGFLSQIDVEGIEPISRQIYIVSHPGRTLSPIGMEFLRFLKRKKEKN